MKYSLSKLGLAHVLNLAYNILGFYWSSLTKWQKHFFFTEKFLPWKFYYHHTKSCWTKVRISGCSSVYVLLQQQQQQNKVLLSFCVYSLVCLYRCMGVHSTIVCMCICVQINGHLWVLFLNDHFVLGDSWGLVKWAGMASQWAQRVPISDASVLKLHIHATISKHHFKWFSWDLLELNSDPHVYMTSALLTELLCQPFLHF